VDSSITSWLNGIAGHPGARPLAVAGAQYLIVVPLLIVAYLAVRSLVRRDLPAVASLSVAAAGTVLALLANMAANALWFRARPYTALADVQALVSRATESSFFSDHTIVVTGCAFGALLVSRRWGAASIVTALLVAVCRVAVGAHYPSDVLTGALITTALIGALLPLRVRIEAGLSRTLQRRGLGIDTETGPPPGA
jgi:undecaprenyl-diphosphatase